MMVTAALDLPAVGTERGDEDFEGFFHAYYHGILNYIYRLIGDWEQAQDLTQDTFIKALCSRAPWTIELPRSWLYTVATNTAFDYLRRRRRITWLPLTEPALPLGTLVLPAPEEIVAQRDQLIRSLKRLPYDQMACLVLHLYCGFTMAEISTILGISVGAVKMRVVRARRQLIRRGEYAGQILTREQQRRKSVAELPIDGLE
jgi:RNA polymerase sigma-70 factor (ECF subfamily)